MPAAAEGRAADEAVRGRIVLLNGTSSAGKSSIAAGLQEILPGYPIHTGIDHIHEHAPSRIHRNAVEGETDVFDGFLWVYERGGSRLTELRLGSSARRLWAGMHAAAIALATAGNDVIVDDLLFDAEVRADAISRFAELDALFVGVHCPISVAEAREQGRDRTPGLARALAGVHDGCTYDVEVDTSISTPEECASLIKRHLDGRPPTSLRVMRASRPPDIHQR